ncbi:MAG: TetR family transcriptional regulator [Proteobacteria bacterium]|nr:MAG: TetR family transcriptional regulator [Pseudomonadota bacterium]
MKTRERIVVTSLALFNEFGEPNVTTLQIADEMDISPGNLYYHYKNKTEILNELYARFDKQMQEILDAPPPVDISIDDQWLFLHLLFETIAQYRFIYQDLVNVMARHPKIANRFKKLMNKKFKASMTILSSLASQNLLNASEDEITALCHNIVLTITYWISYDIVFNKASGEDINLGRGIYQVMALVAPYLIDDRRAMLEEMGRVYIED